MRPQSNHRGLQVFIVSPFFYCFHFLMWRQTVYNIFISNNILNRVRISTTKKILNSATSIRIDDTLGTTMNLYCPSG